jgi:heavy metal sensor kinase
VLSVILIGFSGAVYWLMERHLLALSDAAIREELDELAAEIKRVTDIEQLPQSLRTRFPDQEGYELQVGPIAGAALFRSSGLGPLGLESAAARPYVLDRSTFESVALDGGRPARLGSRMVVGPSGPLVIQAAVTLVPNERALAELVTVLLTLGPVALGCAVGGGYWLARKALAPVDRMAATAAEITATRLDRRLAEPDAQDELGYLAQTFNAMIERLQRSFDEVRRFTADAAHELRTPLAAMRTEAEVALRSPRSADRDARTLEYLLEEIERLTRLVSHLLFLCREDAGARVIEFKRISLGPLVRDVAEHIEVAAREKGVELVVNLRNDCLVDGESDRLRQLFFNLFDNAIKYTPPGGRVTVADGPPNGQVSVTINDTGIGIADEHLPHVFDRFYRADRARGTETGGTGLGLAICRSIAESHGGRLEIASEVGSGTRVSLLLPNRSGQPGERNPGDRPPLVDETGEKEPQ